MTERLYWHDSYLREFTARVVSARPDEEGNGAVLELDRTAFYPTSGGQLHDTGTLDGFRVLEVFEEGGDEEWGLGERHGEAGRGRVLHRVAETMRGGALIDHPVTGRIDWERRFDHMQQHTGQHILSQAAQRVLGAPTLAVHLGADRCTVDLGLAIEAPEAARLEDAANAAVLENRAVRVHAVDESEIERWGLRRPPKTSGVIRVVEIEEFDRSACGGTHVRTTGEIGAIAITGWERYKGGTRLSFLCGWRALRDYRWKSRALTDLGRALSVGGPDVLDTVQRLATKESETSRRADALLTRLAAAEAELRRRATALPAVHVEVLAARPTDEVRALAEALTAGRGLVALLAADGGRLIFARSEDLTLDVAALLRRVFEQFGGRGGGKPAFAQGTLATEASPRGALESARGWAEEALRGA
ncbi:MAG TPA: DHHA1 domain-containing protein [bacterium]|jgi:alanyl-tRNA synthetase|nr:DHHA1 domain-containing protein [bacterium]